ncbi:MAG: hypothetical protein FJ280_23065 [Planctomycetes bacterium]|nr:hypothetical protein [Planctomycetota bacterium]
MRLSERLFDAIHSADSKRFKLLSEECRFLQVICDRSGMFLIHQAVLAGRLAITRYLLERGASITFPSRGGSTALHLAAAKGDSRMMALLLTHLGRSSMPETIVGINPIHIAAAEGHLSIIRLLIQKGASVRSKDRFGRMPVHFAAGSDQLAAVKMLVDLDQSMEGETDMYGHTPLHWAARFGSIRTTPWLLRRGASCTAEDIYGRSPLCLAYTSGKDCISVFRHTPKGASLSLARVSGWTPLHEAAQRGKFRTIRTLLCDGAQINAQDDLGRTALHIAAFNGSRRLYLWLRAHNASKLLVDDYGWTAPRLLSFRLIGRRGD